LRGSGFWALISRRVFSLILLWNIQGSNPLMATPYSVAAIYAKHGENDHAFERNRKCPNMNFIWIGFIRNIRQRLAGREVAIWRIHARGAEDADSKVIQVSGCAVRPRELLRRLPFRPHVMLTSFEDKSVIDRIPPLPFKAMSFRVDTIHICELGLSHSCQRVVRCDT
jgi:hypothetical protein